MFGCQCGQVCQTPAAAIPRPQAHLIPRGPCTEGTAACGAPASGRGRARKRRACRGWPPPCPAGPQCPPDLLDWKNNENSRPRLAGCQPGAKRGAEQQARIKKASIKKTKLAAHRWGTFRAARPPRLQSRCPCRAAAQSRCSARRRERQRALRLCRAACPSAAPSWPRGRGARAACCWMAWQAMGAARRAARPTRLSPLATPCGGPAPSCRSW